MSKTDVVTTIRLPKDTYELLFKEVKWAEKKPANAIIIEGINWWLTEHGYK